MAKLKWDQPGEHYYENGVDHGVLFVEGSDGTFGEGVAWNGLTNVTLSPEGAEPNDIYADNIKYLSLMSAETLSATIEAYQSPKEFDVCDGTEELSATVPGVTIGQQERRRFAFVFRTKKGSDSAAGAGYKLHVLYGCLAAPSERAYETINDSPDAMTLSWDVTTTPVPVTVNGVEKYTSLVTVDSDCAKYTAIENALIGTDGTGSGTGTAPTYKTPDEILTILNQQ